MPISSRITRISLQETTPTLTLPLRGREGNVLGVTEP